MSFPSSLSASDLDGTTGFTITGDDKSFGVSVAAGDVNGDGIDDLIIGRTDTGGESYVIFGRSGSFDASLAVSNLDGSNGFLLTDGTDNSMGRFVASAGDVNDDGLTDILVGGSQTAYVVFGRSEGFAPAVSLTDLDGSDGFAMEVVTYHDSTKVAPAGDVNGDGIEDLVVGSHVVFGQTGAFDPVIALSALDASDGFQVTVQSEPPYVAELVTLHGAGDVNGDGIDDLLAAAAFRFSYYDNSYTKEYIVFGCSDGFGAAFDVSTLDGSNGFAIGKIPGGDHTQTSLDTADINGDGIADAIVGVVGTVEGYAESSRIIVVFGHTGSFAAELPGFDQGNGLVIERAAQRDASGYSIAGARDVNGDGIEDLIIGAPDGNSYDGQAFVVFGQSDGFPDTIALSDLDGTNGFVLNGPNDRINTGYTVAAGDLNGDGVDDIIIGSPGINRHDDGNPTGEVYVVFGQASASPATITGTDGADSLPGTAWDDSITGHAGNDTLLGLGGNDTLVGNSGADRMDGGDGDDSLKAGIGDDRLWGGDGNDTLNGEGGEDRLYGGDGDDRLIGWNSHDTMTGGAGADTFVFHPDITLSWTGDAPDVITDFSRTEGDRINLVNFGLPDYAALQALFVAAGADTVINLSGLPGGRDILVAGVTLADLDHQANFVL